MKLEERDDWLELLSALEHFGEGDYKVIEAACRQARKVPELKTQLAHCREAHATRIEQFCILAAGFQASQDLLAHYRIHSSRPPRDSLFAAIAAAKDLKLTKEGV